MKKYNVVDLFAGVGGLSYGFSQMSEFNIVMANEILSDISKIYEANHPGVTVINDDIANLTEDRLLSVTGGVSIDVVVGGPPCQSYSTLGKREMDDRANMFLEYKRVLNILKPKAFIFENVAGLLSMQNGRLFKRIQSEFESIGYIVKYKLLNASSYGVPQDRKRIILVGFRGENNFKYPTETHGHLDGMKPLVTLGDALGDLPSISSGEEGRSYEGEPSNEFQNFVRKGGSTTLSMHASPKNNPKLIRIMESLKDGQGKDDLPESIRPSSGYGNTYAKLWWDRPSTTVTRNFSTPSSSRCIHPRDSRALSNREGARLQSFPDDYKFFGSNTSIRLGIGNAVPCLLSIKLAEQMLEALDR